ncbi:divalent-cation tolerance protein CutA [Leptospira sp. 2 VSF19]|uniref:Divalent-cation tolerance protein CutA n=1 Tax=Leptospira soteropolitanensis TaxID=2950025 RepID=A0AAW5VPJ2_9LEPT|nr:divalent-cation tolerance protein CutA [Leptospira soteropolitanensis]MCW7494372.1 divalent-cation tolerance protein CutA [Leptospira soteropolitanensis]MCW7501919.1 divalent-cation tolerance protein CutA [Leptospira soteropolitanensis]MCW7524218.1 divalent-cation tolerance protein CutA [Leptospira soteropolitanensis]MCW7528083.1 divalent-cation tolerance protein CutA [Leptospira soteropolitanensis]MCW7531937.1 divalent-cation tolerance protein CutA [Leptospira soteropolitanensis]
MNEAFEFSTLYVTFPSEEEAKKIAKVVVTERLAACANIIKGMDSIYTWNEVLEEATEFVSLFKTTKDKVGLLMQRIKELHSYKTPCIVEWPIVSGNPDYLDWIRKSL